MEETQTNGTAQLVKRIGTGLPGPGRPKKSDELSLRKAGLAAIKKLYGSEEGLLKFLLNYKEHKEPSLVLAGIARTYGKLPDGADSGKMKLTNVTITVIESKTINNGVNQLEG